MSTFCCSAQNGLGKYCGKWLKQSATFPNGEDMSQEATHEWLQYYLRDHFAGAAAGVNLFDRVARGHSDPQVRAQVARMHNEVVQERQILRSVMAELDVRRVSATMYMAVIGERVGRLKPNGAILKRSTGADILELEALSAAVQIKARMWGTLLALADTYPRIDADLMRRMQDQAVDQQRTIVALHTQVVSSLQTE